MISGDRSELIPLNSKFAVNPLNEVNFFRTLTGFLFILREKPNILG